MVPMTSLLRALLKSRYAIILLQTADYCFQPFTLSEEYAVYTSLQMVTGQNGTDKMVWTKWYTDKMVLDKMVSTKWYRQIGTILYFVYTLIQLNSMCI